LNKHEHINQLLEKYRQQACTAEELQELHSWLDEQAAAGQPYLFNGEEEKSQLKNKIQQAVLGAMPAPAPVRKINPLRWMRYAAAAVGIIVLGVTIAYFFNRPHRIIVAAAPGKMERAVLPDGSTVWLNDNSEVSYYSNFAGHRNIELTKGEAFFQVMKDAAHPFTVQSHDISTTVKGTSFSVKMIAGTGDIKVSVVTGKVLVHKQQDTLGFLLPGDRLRFRRRLAATTVDKVQPGEANAWMNGELFLQNASLNEVTQWLHDHFNVTIENRRTNYTGDYYLQVKKDITLPEIIKILNLLGSKDHIQFSQNNQTVIIQ
jgi:transmembrane sensor